jgi:hypothetical protein
MVLSIFVIKIENYEGQMEKVTGGDKQELSNVITKLEKVFKYNQLVEGIIAANNEKIIIETSIDSVSSDAKNVLYPILEDIVKINHQSSFTDSFFVEIKDKRGEVFAGARINGKQ